MIAAGFGHELRAEEQYNAFVFGGLNVWRFECFRSAKRVVRGVVLLTLIDHERLMSISEVDLSRDRVLLCELKLMILFV